jgi:hypothetical protein
MILLYLQTQAIRQAAREAGATVLQMDAHPAAAGFYRRMGGGDDDIVPLRFGEG